MPYAHPSGFPSRALDCADDGEGQALALREGKTFFTVARGPRMPHAHPSGFHRDVERVMKYPQLIPFSR